MQSVDPRIIKTSKCGKYVIVQAKNVPPAAFRSRCNLNPEYCKEKDLDIAVRHQDTFEKDYLTKNPDNYCWIRLSDIDTVLSDQALVAEISANIGEFRARDLRNNNETKAKSASEAWSRELRRLQNEARELAKKANNNQVLVQPMFDPWD